MERCSRALRCRGVADGRIRQPGRTSDNDLTSRQSRQLGISSASDLTSEADIITRAVYAQCCLARMKLHAALAAPLLYQRSRMEDDGPVASASFLHRPYCRLPPSVADKHAAVRSKNIAHGRSIAGSAANRVFETAAADRPASEARFQQREDRVHADAHHADYDKCCEDKRDVEVGTGDQHHVADAVVARDDLRDDGADK